MDAAFTKHGFLPHPDPLQKLPPEFESLDTLGRDLPSLLEDKDARLYLKGLTLPPWPDGPVAPGQLPALRLYYVRMGFVASGYVNQIGQPPSRCSLRTSLCHAARLLDRPPILSYDGYALFN